MIAEQITVTTTAASIKALLDAVRTAAVPDKCVGIMLRYAGASAEVVTLTDPGSAAGAIILDGDTESLVNASFKSHSLTEALLSTDTDSVLVEVIVEQDLV